MAKGKEETVVEKPATEQPAAQATGTALAVVDFGEDAGAGLDNITSEERTLPFINMIQKGSAQVDETHPLYATKQIKDAKPGMILRSNTNEAFDVRTKPFIFIPAHRDRNFVESWPKAKPGQPAPAGQGFVGIRQADDPLVLKLLEQQGKFKVLITPEGTQLVDTWYLYGIYVMQQTETNLPDYAFAGVSRFKSTQIPYYKRFIDIIDGIKYPNAEGVLKKPAIWAHQWTLSTMPDSNKLGSYYSWDLKLANGASGINPRPALMKRDDPYYVAGKELYEAIRAGKAKVDHAAAEAEEVSGGAGGGAEKDDNIPF